MEERDSILSKKEQKPLVLEKDKEEEKKLAADLQPGLPFQSEDGENMIRRMKNKGSRQLYDECQETLEKIHWGDVKKLQKDQANVANMKRLFNGHKREAENLREKGRKPKETVSLKQDAALDYADTRIESALFLDAMSSHFYNSDLMNDCHDSIEALEQKIRIISNMSEITKDHLNSLMVFYELAISACAHYCEVRRSTRDSAVKRRSAVERVMHKLVAERNRIQEGINGLRKDQKTSWKAFLSLPADMPLEKKRTNESSDYGRVVQNAAPAEWEEDFAEMLYSSTQDMRNRMADAGRFSAEWVKVIRDYEELYLTLAKPAKGQAHAGNITWRGRKLRFLHNAGGELFLVEKGKLHKLRAPENQKEKTVWQIRDALAREFVYGDSHLEVPPALQEAAIANMEESESNRDTLCKFIQYHSSYQSVQMNDFDDSSFEKIRTLALSCFAMDGDSYSRMMSSFFNTERDWKRKKKAEEEVARERARLEAQKREERRKEQEEKRKKEEENRKKEEALLKKLTDSVIISEEEEEEESDFTKEEKKVLAFVSDILAMEDVVTEEFYKGNPVPRLQHVLEQHKAILVSLFNENGKETLLLPLLKKMNLQWMEEKGPKEKPEITPSEAILSLYDSLKTFFKKGKEAPENQNEGENRIIEEPAPLTEEDIVKAVYSEKEEMKQLLSELNDKLDHAVDSCIAYTDAWFKNSTSIINVTVGKPKNKGDLDDSLREKKEKEYTQEGKALYQSVITDYYKNGSISLKKTFLADLLRNKTAFVPYDPKTKKSEWAEKQLNDEKRKSKDPDSVDWEKRREELYEIDNTCEVAGRTLDSMLNCGGPIHQKYIQSIFVDSNTPTGIQKTVLKARGRLKKIPRIVVKAELENMINKSHGVLKNVIVEKSMGSATIGEVLLCRLFGPNLPKYGKQVVIKVRRPDAMTRLKEEANAVKKIAKTLDNTTGSEEKGESERIMEDRIQTTEEELDFVQEGKNSQEGILYETTLGENEKEVGSVKVIEGLTDADGVLVMEFVEGKTAGDMAKELSQQRARLEKEREKNRNADDEIIPERIEEIEKNQRAAEKLTFEALKNKNKLMKLSKAWLTESLNKSGFFHGDLHSGNVMVNEDQAVFIDFGNAKKLQKGQNEHIKNMLKGLQNFKNTGGETFINSFFKAVGKEEPSEEEKKKVQDVWTEVSSKLKGLSGDYMNGMISMAFELSLTMLKNAGFVIPMEILDFSRTLTQLSNTVNEYSSEVESMRFQIMDWMEDRYKIIKQYKFELFNGKQLYQETSTNFDTVLKDFLKEN